MRRHLAVSISAGVLAALTGIVSCAVRADGLTDQQIAFAARLVQAESGGNQRDRTGAVLVSSAGARGLFQLMPATAARFGVDPNTAAGNVRGGLSLIVRLWDRYHGNERAVSAAFNCGETCADDWLAGRRVLPAETQHYVDAVANGNTRMAGNDVPQKEAEARNPRENTSSISEQGELPPDTDSITTTYEGDK